MSFQGNGLQDLDDLVSDFHIFSIDVLHTNS